MGQYDVETLDLIQQAKENRVSNPRLVLEVARILRDKAKATQDKKLLGIADYCVADAYFALNDEVGLEHYASRAMNSLREVKEWELLGRTYNVAALMDMRIGRMAHALEMLSRAIHISEEHHLYILETILYMNVADVCAQLESDNDALHYILLAESFLKECDGEEQQDYYYMIASTEGALFAKKLKQIEEEKKQRAILAGVLKRHPEYGDDVCVLLLMYQEAQDNGESEKAEGHLEQLQTAFFSSPSFLDYTNELMHFLEILQENKKYRTIDEMLEYITQSLNGHESPGIMYQVSNFKVQYFKEVNRKKDLEKELENFWNYSRFLQKQTNTAIISLIDVHQDLEASNKNNKRLRKLADTDELTFLPNRRALNEKLDQIFERSYREKRYLGVEMLDVDNFKQVNDTYGHSTGDDVLVLIGKVLKEICSESIYTARYGGDEFVIVYDNMDDEAILKNGVRIKDLFAQGIQEISLVAFTVSQGIYAKIPIDDNKVWDYTSTADAALYMTKKNGKNNLLLIHSPKELEHTTANTYI